MPLLFLGTNAISAVSPMENHCDSKQTRAVVVAGEAKEDAEHSGVTGAEHAVLLLHNAHSIHYCL